MPKTKTKSTSSTARHTAKSGGTRVSLDLDPKLSKQHVVDDEDDVSLPFTQLRVSKQWHVRIPTATDDIREAVVEKLAIRIDDLDNELADSASNIGSWAGPWADLKAKLRDAKDDLEDVEDELRDKYRENPKSTKGRITVDVISAWVRMHPRYKKYRRRMRRLEMQFDMVDQALKAMNKKYGAIVELSQRKRQEGRLHARDSIEVERDEPTPT